MMLKRKLGVIIVGIIVIGMIGALSLDQKSDDSRVFHVTLADPQIYTDGVFFKEFILEPGEYRLRFVPNGDSPKILSITIDGESVLLSEQFMLKGTLHNAGSSEYYTWEYLGEHLISNTGTQTVQITIDPNGDLLGPVSVSLLK